ncbi:MAG TPA: type II toxin-antitoxin system VapC family toxin, partial [Rectinemataceae bacterium]
MVIDSSAVIATLFAEPETDAFLEAMARPGRKYMSSVNKLETMIVVEAKKGPKGSEALARFLAAAGIEVLPFDSSQSEIAMAAWRRFGRGRHPAG